MIVEADDRRVRGAGRPGRAADAPRRGLPVHRGPGVEPARALPVLLATSPPTIAGAGARSAAWSSTAHPTFKANGLVLDRDGRARRVRAGLELRRRGSAPAARASCSRTTTAAATSTAPTTSSCAPPTAAIYFTDPDYGRWNDWIGQERSARARLPRRLPHPARRRTARRELLVPQDEFDQPNGLCFSPDESLLYVNDSDHGHIKVFDVAADGTLGPARVFVEGIGVGFSDDDSDAIREARHQELHDAGAVDGMKCDERGNVWVTGPGGVWVLSPGGERLGRIRAPEVVGNLTLGRRGPAHALPDDLDDRAQPARRASRPRGSRTTADGRARGARREGGDPRPARALPDGVRRPRLGRLGAAVDRGRRVGRRRRRRSRASTPCGSSWSAACRRDYIAKHLCGPVGDRGRPRRRERPRARPTSSGSPRTTTTRSSPATSTRSCKRDGRWRICRREEVAVPFRPGPPPMSRGLARAQRRHDAKGRRCLITSTSC